MTYNEQGAGGKGFYNGIFVDVESNTPVDSHITDSVVFIVSRQLDAVPLNDIPTKYHMDEFRKARGIAWLETSHHSNLHIYIYKYTNGTPHLYAICVTGLTFVLNE